MVSSALGALRNAAQKQADIYNPYITDAASIRQNQNISDGYRLTQLEARVTRATNALQDLLDSANKAETTIRNKAAALSSAGPASEVNEIARANILLAWDNSKQDISKVCNILVSQNDRSGFQVLRAMLPYLNGADRDAAESVRLFELQLYTRDEKAVLAEEAELHTNVMLLRNNFDTLFNFFEGQTLPTAVAGMFARLNDLNPWYGLMPAMRAKIGIDWDDLSRAQRIQLLSGDFVQGPVSYTAPASYGTPNRTDPGSVYVAPSNYRS